MCNILQFLYLSVYISAVFISPSAFFCTFHVSVYCLVFFMSCYVSFVVISLCKYFSIFSIYLCVCFSVGFITLYVFFHDFQYLMSHYTFVSSFHASVCLILIISMLLCI